MRTLIIVNNAAARARAVWPKLQQQLRAAAVEYEFHATTGPGDATVQTRSALKRGINTVGVVGGDGTLSEAAEGFFEFNKDLGQHPNPINPMASLATLPAGTGDDFARGLHGSRAKLDYWLGRLLRHCNDNAANTTRLVDVLYGRCNGYHKPFICLNASTMGIGGDTAARVAAQGPTLRRFSGELRFVLAAVEALAHWRERRALVTVDGRTVVDCRMNLAAVANALYAGGGMMLSPMAKVDDGKLDVVTACDLTRIQVVRELARIHSGRHVKNPKVAINYGSIVRIDTFASGDAMPLEADGNVRGHTPAQFEVMPAALRFVV
ncbi:MAG: diacylglycerol kinase family protein [Pyrinomonadaceae bacterium]